MGIEFLPEECKERYREWLSEMRFISVRESLAANIIYELSGITVPVVLVPVFLHSKYERRKICIC